MMVDVLGIDGSWWERGRYRHASDVSSFSFSLSLPKSMWLSPASNGGTRTHFCRWLHADTTVPLTAQRGCFNQLRSLTAFFFFFSLLPVPFFLFPFSLSFRFFSLRKKGMDVDKHTGKLKTATQLRADNDEVRIS